MNLRNIWKIIKMIEMLIAMKIVNRKRNVKRVKRHTSFINRIFGIYTNDS